MLRARGRKRSPKAGRRKSKIRKELRRDTKERVETRRGGGRGFLGRVVVVGGGWVGGVVVGAYFTQPRTKIYMYPKKIMKGNWPSTQLWITCVNVYKRNLKKVVPMWLGPAPKSLQISHVAGIENYFCSEGCPASSLVKKKRLKRGGSEWTKLSILVGWRLPPIYLG